MLRGVRGEIDAGNPGPGRELGRVRGEMDDAGRNPRCSAFRACRTTIIRHPVTLGGSGSPAGANAGRRSPRVLVQLDRKSLFNMRSTP